MNKLLILLLILCPLISSAQNEIRGKIIDKKTGQPIPFANIYLNKSQIGTTSRVDGTFVLSYQYREPIDLFVSFVGFKTVKRTIKNQDDELLIELVQNPLLLTAYEVKSSKDKTWQRQLRRFKSIFLGTNEFAAQCEILNPWVLSFSESNGTFSASSDQVLKIRNEALGYLVIYYLENFEHTSKLTLYNGLTSFEELDPVSVKQYNKWQLNRSIAYRGSLRHFLKACIDNNLSANGFEAEVVQQPGKFIVKNESREGDISRIIRKGSEIFRVKDSSRLVDFENHILIRYFDESKRDIYQLSWINSNFPTPMDDWGNLANSTGIITYGSMADEGFAYILPLEYRSEVANSLAYNFNRKVIKPFTDYHYYRPTEKIHLHTDKEQYFSDESIWVKGYMTVNEEPSQLSTKLYLRLTGGDTVDIKTITPVVNGNSSGHITIPPIIKHGKYLLTAYTDWTDSLNEQYHFRKEITIGVPDQEEVRKTVVEDVKIKVYPEGGNIINDVVNKVAFEIRNARGKLINAQIQVFDDHDKLITTARTKWQGKGIFSFKPKRKKAYHILVNGKLKVPLAISESLSIATVLSKQEDGVKVELASNKGGQQIVHMLVTNNEKVKAYQSINLRKETEIVLPYEQLGSGINQFTFFDLGYRPFSERLIFVEPTIENNLAMELAANTLKKRSKSVITLNGSEDIHSASLAVIDIDQTSDHGNESIFVSTYLRPGIKGTITGADTLFGNAERNEQALDLLMMVNGWRRYNWEQIKEEKNYSEDSLQLNQGFTISGHVRRSEKGKLISNELVYLIASDSSSQIYESITDDKGQFVFKNVVYTDSSKLVFKLADPKYSRTVTYFINKQNHFPDSVSLPQIAVDDLFDNNKERLVASEKRRAKLRETYGFNGRTYYLKEAVIKGKRKEKYTDVHKIWTPPKDDIVKLDDLKRSEKLNIFQVINTQFRGIMAVRETTSYGLEFKIVMINSRRMTFLGGTQGKMLLLLNGRPISTQNLYEINLDVIESIEVVRGQEASIFGGSAAATGAILVYTKQDPMAYNGTKPPKFFSTTLSGFQKYKEFYHPDHSEEDLPYIPDYRTTLYWNPEITSNTRTIEYYNHDNESNIKVIMEGFTKEGKPFRLTDYYQVSDE